MRRLAAGILALAALGAGCGEEGPEVRVFAASSLTDVLGTLAADFEEETGTRVRLNLASSSTLAKQIVEGARCDLFLSADEEWAAFVRREERAGTGAAEVLLANRMVVVLADPSLHPYYLGGDLDEARWGDESLRRALTAPGIRRIAVGDPEHVPAGRYARKGLEALGIWDACRDRLVPCESVRAALALVKRGEADAGIVYRTDALASGLPVVVNGVLDYSEFVSAATPQALHGQALHGQELPGVEARVLAVPCSGVTGSPGALFLSFLRTDRATAVFTKAGFLVPGRSR
ncbi:MAG: molybdate ABC transporter substrate-binding protein [Planctomycetes bacterium]|nr:molybdate ABC transporter substrate-binding protein [Planctomycetota bacterium]